MTAAVALDDVLCCCASGRGSGPGCWQLTHVSGAPMPSAVAETWGQEADPGYVTPGHWGLAQLFVPCVRVVYPHLFVLSSDITLRYKEIRRQKQEHRHEKDKCLSNGDGHPSVLDEQDGSKLRDRKL